MVIPARAAGLVAPVPRGGLWPAALFLSRGPGKSRSALYFQICAVRIMNCETNQIAHSGGSRASRGHKVTAQRDEREASRCCTDWRRAGIRC